MPSPISTKGLRVSAQKPALSKAPNIIAKRSTNRTLFVLKPSWKRSRRNLLPHPITWPLSCETWLPFVPTSLQLGNQAVGELFRRRHSQRSRRTSYCRRIDGSTPLLDAQASPWLAPSLRGRSATSANGLVEKATRFVGRAKASRSTGARHLLLLRRGGGGIGELDAVGSESGLVTACLFRVNTRPRKPIATKIVPAIISQCGKLIDERMSIYFLFAFSPRYSTARRRLACTSISSASPSPFSAMLLSTRGKSFSTLRLVLRFRQPARRRSFPDQTKFWIPQPSAWTLQASQLLVA